MAANSGGSSTNGTTTGTGSGSLTSSSISSTTGPTSSTGEWNSLIKPFVAYTVGSLSTTELTTLLKAIIDSKEELKESVLSSHPYSIFYDVVTVLSAHVLTASAVNNLLQRSSFPIAIQAAKLLAESLLSRFPTIVRSVHPILNAKTYISVIQEFSSGKLAITQEEVANMLALLKNQELPSNIQSTSPSTWDKDGTSSSATGKERRSRLDPSVLLFEQIAIPVISISSEAPLNELLAQEVLRIFQSLKASQKFVELCLVLPNLKTFHTEKISLQSEVIRSFYAKHISRHLSHDLANIAEELSFVFRLLEMSLFAPLNSNDAHQLTQLGISTLNAAFYAIQYMYNSSSHSIVSTSNTPGGMISSSPSHLREGEHHRGVTIVAQAIWAQKRIIAVLKDDSGLSQNTWLNYSFVVSKILIQNFHSYMFHAGQSTSGETHLKTRAVGPPVISLIAVQSVWNECIIAMSSLAVSLVQNFIGLFFTDIDNNGPQKPSSTFNISSFKIDTQMSNSERIKYWFQSDINELEFWVQILTLSYRKACRLKMLKYSKQRDEQQQSLRNSKQDNHVQEEKKKKDSVVAPPKDSKSKEVVTGLKKVASHEVETNHTGNEVDVEIEDENHSVSDLMTTEDEEDQDDDDDNDDDDDEIDIDVEGGVEGDDDDERLSGRKTHDDNDDEPILGKWFESVLSPPENKTPEDEIAKSGKDKGLKPSDGMVGDSDHAFLNEFMAEKSAQGFIESALAVVSFLTKHLISNCNPIVQDFVKEHVNESTLSLIAIVLRDLDQERANTEIGAISTVFDESLNRLYLEFSSELGKLVQNFLAQKLLSSNYLTFFLEQLGIDLVSGGRWPLSLYPRTLAVLVQVVLLKVDKENYVVQIWKRFLETLASDISCLEITANYEDLPVEHAQTLVFLFHTLSLMQKKAVMIEASHTLVKVSLSLKGEIQLPHQITSLGRLLLIFDYLVRQLYEPDLRLVNQIQYNLFNEVSVQHQKSLSSTSNQLTASRSQTKIEPATSKQQQNKEDSDPSNIPPTSKPLPPSRLFADCPPLLTSNSNSGKDSASLDEIPLPKFYNLLCAEPNYQENPKLDGLSLNFMMNKNDANHRDKTEYIEIIAGLLRITQARMSKNVVNSCPAAVHYMEYMLTRLLYSLPPPFELLEKLRSKTFTPDLASTFYNIIWIPRLQNRIYGPFVRDTFSKQGLNPTSTDEVISKTMECCNTSNFSFMLLQSLKEWVVGLSSKSNSKCPTAIYTIEACLAYLTANLETLFNFDKEADAEKLESELFQCIEVILSQGLTTMRSKVIESVRNDEETGTSTQVLDTNLLTSLNHISSISSAFLINNNIALVAEVYVDPKYQVAFENINGCGTLSLNQSQLSFPTFSTSQFGSDLIPNESYIIAVVNGHMKEGSNEVISLRNILGSIVKFVRAIITHGDRTQNLKEKLEALLSPLLLDATTEYLGEMINQSGEREFGKVDGTLNGRLLQIVLEKGLKIIAEPRLRAFVKKDSNAFIEELLDTLCALVKQREKDSEGKIPVNDIVCKTAFRDRNGQLFRGLVSLLMTSKNTGVIRKCCNFLTVILSAVQYPQDMESVLVIISAMPEMKELPRNVLSLELYEDENLVASVTSFMSSILNLSTQILASDGSDEKSKKEVSSFLTVLLKETINMTKNCMLSRTSGGVLTTRPYRSFCLVVKVLTQLAGLCLDKEPTLGLSGHGQLFQQMTEWFSDLVQELDSFFNVSSEDEEESKRQNEEPYLRAFSAIIEYLLDMGGALYTLGGSSWTSALPSTSSTAILTRHSERESTPGSVGNVSPPNEPEDNFDNCESELGYEQGDDEDSAGEDSDDDGLNSRLCTYTITQKEFMSQHWYHCHTCGMVDGVGVCSICARVCHRGHDVTYAKFGSFFCDCGARTDAACLALTRRSGAATGDVAPTQTQAGVQAPEKRSSLSADSVTDTHPSSMLSTIESKNSNGSGTVKHSKSASNVYQGKTVIGVSKQNMEELMREFHEFSCRTRLLTIKKLSEIVSTLANQKTGIGAYRRVQDALRRLRSGKGARSDFDASDDLMIATLGSQEGAFENIKMQFNGDQGSVIRQLINAQVIRHTTIAALSAPLARRHYLAVSQEKNKLTILQLGALLCGGDSSRKKLTLPRLATLSLPFMALTMATNPIRDDVIAICGLKDCEIVVIGTGGSISQPLVISTSLEGQNHIIKPIWVAGSEMELALVTTDSVKIYDLGSDLHSPVYHFLIPSGKIRDATFIIQGDNRYIAIMGTEGRIYYEKLEESTNAKNGSYYITDDLNGEDCDLNTSETTPREPNDSKGVSLYYSHALKLLFYTYPNGKSYVGTIDNLSESVPISRAVLITPDSSAKPCNLGLHLWIEVIGHPGLIFAMGANSIPHVLLLTGKGNYIQEIKLTGKIKPIDLVAIRHPGYPNDKMKTSLLIIFDDGSLRVCDGTEKTEYWLNPRLRPQGDWLSQSLSTKSSNLPGGKHLSKLIGVNRRMSKYFTKNPGGQIMFPADFFEHCQPLTDVEFGGSDLLLVYNVAQLKNRLNNAGMYIVCSKSTGFSLEATCSDGSMVIMGLRVLLGSQDINRVPSFIQVFGRSIPVNMTRPRWYDIPLTREESLLADQKITITFTPSSDPGSITIVDSVKIYGKSKEAFGWPDEVEDIAQAQAVGNAVLPSSSGQQLNKLSSDDCIIEKLITNCLELCELSFTICRKEATDTNETLKLVTSIYLENYSSFNYPCRNFMCSILANKIAYYEHRDFAVLSRSLNSLMELDEKIERDIDPELFHHVVNCIKNIAVLRPQHILNYEYCDTGFGEMSVTRVIATLCSVFNKLIQTKPKNPFVVPLDAPGIQRTEHVAMGLADIIYSLMVSDINLVFVLAPYLMSLLICEDGAICVPVRTVIVKRIRPKNLKKKSRAIAGPSPPHCTTPDTAVESPREAPANTQNQQPPAHVEIDEPIIMLGGRGHDQENEEMQLAPMLNMNPLDEYMGDPEDGYPPVIDIQSDAEDEAMVELAIALSLQEQAGGAALAIQGIQDGLQALEDLHQDVLNVAEGLGRQEEDEEEDEREGGRIAQGNEGGGESDDDARTASPPGSDDEAIATEGSTMRNSERGGSGSSGSSNAGGTNPGHEASNAKSQDSNPGTSREIELSERGSNRNADATQNPTPGVGSGQAIDMKPFKIALLKALSAHVAQCNSALSLIPLLQVTLVIISDLDGSSEEEPLTLESLVRDLMKLMNLKNVSRENEWVRNDTTEMTLVILRMLSICLARWRGTDQKADNNWIAKVTAKTIEECGMIPFCREMLHVLRDSWRGSEEAETTPAGAVAGASLSSSVLQVLRAAPVTSPPDFTPFFVKPYIKSHSNDILEELPLLLSEMVLRIPYQVKKVLNKPQLFDVEWEELLCEILQNRNVAFVRRQARKLLLNIADNRENYHLLRDLYNMNFHLTEFYKLIGYARPLPVDPAKSTSFVDFMQLEKPGKNVKLEFRYSQLVAMVEHLNICIEIATQRPASWQTFCGTSHALQFIVQMSCTADESLTNSILTLLKLGVEGVSFESKTESPLHKLSDAEKAERSLAHQIIDQIDKRTFLEFLKKYLLEHPQLQTRWLTHSLVLGFYLTSDCFHQLKLVNALWDLWAFVPAAGIRASQFVDILGYATLNNEELKSKDLREQMSRCITSIEQQGNNILAHPNSSIYSSLVPFVSVDGYYLESEPCEVCHNVDKAYSSQKLASIKADSKFTAGCQIIKLTTTLNIIRLSMRLSEVKKVRMIKTMAIYYSPRNISIVDLKNSRNLWQMARKVTLVSGQTEVKFDFSVPITAANLIIEFIDFYENVQATAETLQCPRCSASVPATPGVCSNCGENVFQCHKCRAINYDERDPFLCHSCGFCKYAKMDITLLAKSIVAVDPVENEEDHKKAETAISTLLEKADITYKQQQQIKANLETMLQSIKERRSMSGLTAAALPALPGSTATTTASSSGAAGSSQHHSYAAVAAAANALNNNLVALNIGGLTGANLPGALGIIGSNGGHLLHSNHGGSAAPTNLVLKNVQSLAYCYAIDCKNSYEELNRLMRKVSAFRKEMLKLDPTSYALDTMDNITCRKCYGCMASGITLSLKLLQALITAGSPRDPFDSSFLRFLLRLSQSAGSTVLKEQVKNALCFFVKDDFVATSQLTDLINARVVAAFNKESWSDVSFETSEEISLLASLLQMYDSCWEIKLRSLMKIFTHAVKRLQDPAVSESGLLPCLKIIQNFIRTTQGGEKEKLTVSQLEGVNIDLEAWLEGDEKHSFESWKRRLPKAQPVPPEQKQNAAVGPGPSSSQQTPTSSSASTVVKKRRDSTKKEKKELNTHPVKPQAKTAPTVRLSRAQLKQTYYIKKYGRTWVDKLFRMDSNAKLEFAKELSWMRKLIFCPGSIQTRTVTAALLKDLAQTPQRRVKIMELLTSFMEDLPTNGESCREFMELYRDLAIPGEYSAFLNVKGALNIVCKLLDDRIERLHHLESITLHSDLSQGVAVYELSRLLTTLAIPSVRRTKRVSLLSTVLSGYLALKRLRLHRTRPIEEAQEILLQLLEEITSGTEEETKVFMSVCVETLKKCPKEDLATPVFIFERLCSLIVHEESDVAEFYLILDKDPQQEDFLQGRMLGNPYSSTDNGLGPLMRDVKNKICTDCELVALLEDDNGMELLINNKIISLDLPVKEVYKRLWVPTNGQGEPMRIVYRMRGLLGDATEEFVETFASPSDSPEDNEITYKLANVLVQCGGLQVVLSALKNLLEQQFIMSKSKPFIAVILKLVTYCVKTKHGRKALTDPTLNAVQSLLPVLKLCLEHDLTSIQGSSGVVHLTDQVLEILDLILTDASLLNEQEYEIFAKSRGSIEDIRNLLNLTDRLRGKSATLTTYLKVLGCLTYKDKEAMSLILDSYKDYCEFFRYDEDPNPEFSFKLEQLCILVTNIQVGPYGGTFKELALERSTIEKCLNYLRTRAPNFQPPLGRPDSDEWKDMASKPALKYVLRLLAGFASNHSPTQEALGSEYVCVIHQLEQVSSDEHVGSLAENALEALRSNDKIWREVEDARRATREEKKRMAMAMRARQLNTMGMKTNDRGQVTTAISSMLDQMEDLAEETGLVCVICREGYKYQPTKVLGIYTFSKKCLVEDADIKARKMFGYCTVSHFNVVHIDCHMAAIRLARSRDEWESASLQNGNTRCNGLIPLWGTQVPESAFAACLARHNAYLQEATANRDVGFSSGVHDIKLLLLRFAEEKTFHEDTGGGGPESNMHLIPYLFHTALYVLNTTRVSQKENSSVEKFLAQAPSVWKDELATVEGTYYLLVVTLMIHPPSKFMENRVIWLKRVLANRGFRTNRCASAEFSNYRPGLIFLGLIYGLYTIVFKDVSETGDWPSLLADYIRRNDEALIKSTVALLTLYQQKLLSATCIEDFVEVLGLTDHNDLKNVSIFVTELWNQLL